MRLNVTTIKKITDQCAHQQVIYVTLLFSYVYRTAETECPAKTFSAETSGYFLVSLSKS